MDFARLWNDVDDDRLDVPGGPFDRVLSIASLLDEAFDWTALGIGKVFVDNLLFTGKDMLVIEFARQARVPRLVDGERFRSRVDGRIFLSSSDGRLLDDRSSNSFLTDDPIQ